MDAGTVLVLGNALHGSDVAFLATVDLPVAVVTPDPHGPGAEYARVCAEISRIDPVGPLSIVAFGEAAVNLPHVARAQRASHRRISEYVLVGPTLPPVTDTWPDAPVTVYCDPTDEASLTSRLRGWTVLPSADLPAWRPVD